MKAAILICGETCIHRVYNPTLEQRAYSDIGSNCGLGVLGGEAWCEDNNNVNQLNNYLQLDSGSITKLSGVVIQGKSGSDERVTSIKFLVSNDTDTWVDVDNNGAIFNGNTDADSELKIYFPKIQTGRFIRFVPQSFNVWPSMRAGILFCSQKSVVRHQICTNKIVNPTINFRQTNGNHAGCTTSASL